jgi:predicted small integral membrane protein
MTTSKQPVQNFRVGINFAKSDYPSKWRSKVATSLWLGLAGLRSIKAVLVLLIALFALLVAFNNVVDYGSNFMFVQHVLAMDTTFEGNTLQWRALTQPWQHHAAYAVIIACEFLTGLLCGVGACLMWSKRMAAFPAFHAAVMLASWGLVLGLVLWFGGFMVVGAEWFLMWQSPSWNGQEAAFRFLVSISLTLIFIHLQEPAHVATESR